MKLFRFRNWLFLLIGVLLLFYLFNAQAVHYGVRQGKGQLKVVWNAKEVDDILKDPSTPDSILNQLKLVAEIKKFCQDHLQLDSKNNYTTLFDQKGQPGMYVVSASLPYKLESYQWGFPFLGKFSYKGFFDKELGKAEQTQLDHLGYDTDLDDVNAWSTLGWFKDPIMSSMLQLSEGKLARVLIHEITHFNVFVKDDITYNENLASFIGDKGTIAYLTYKYGADSDELLEFINYLYDLDLFTKHIVSSAEELNVFYDTLQNKSYRLQLKQKKISGIIERSIQLPYRGAIKLDRIKEMQNKINNSFFTDFLTYKSYYPKFENELKDSFSGDIVQFIQYQKQKHGN